MKISKRITPGFKTIVLGCAILTIFTTNAIAQTADRSPATVIVKMVDKSAAQWRFEPSEFIVMPGDTVRFVQEDIVPHNVEFTKSPKASRIDNLRMGPFLMTLGETYDVVISENFVAGTYKFVCTPHRSLRMVGEMTVVNNDEIIASN